MEQRKLSDQANTLVDLSKVSVHKSVLTIGVGCQGTLGGHQLLQHFWSRQMQNKTFSTAISSSVSIKCFLYRF